MWYICRFFISLVVNEVMESATAFISEKVIVDFMAWVVSVELTVGVLILYRSIYDSALWELTFICLV